MEKERPRIRIAIINTDDSCVDVYDADTDTDTYLEQAWDRAMTLSSELNVPLAVKWDRSTDGQVAFWGPGGASFEPVWTLNN